MLYGVLPRPDARLLPQVLSPHPAPHPGPRTRPRASAPAPRLALWFSRSGPRIRSSHSCLRTPASALLPPHPGPHSGPVFRAVHSGLALRPRPAPTFCPALWVADLKGGFWKEAFAFRAQAPVPAFWPCIPALTTRSSRPGSSHSALRRPRTSTHAPRLALRSYTPAPCSGRDGSCASSPHSGPRAPTPGPRPRTPPSHPASRFGPRTPARTPVPFSGRCAPVSRSGPVFRAAYPGPVLRPRPAPHILPHALGGGFWRRLLRSGPALRLCTPVLALRPPAPRFCTPPPALRSRTPSRVPALAPWPRTLGGGFWRRLLPPGPLPHFVPRSRPRAPAPAFPPRISGGGFEGGFSGNILERRIPGGCFEGRGLRSGSCVRPRRCVSELRILANRQNKVYL